VVVAEIFAGAIPDVNYLQAVSLLKTYDLSILTGYDILTGIVSPVVKPEATIKEFSLSQNYPNPFNPTTIISWQLAVGSFVTLKVYDVLGREVKILVNEFQETGTHSINFDATKLASGIYFYQLKAGNFVSTKKMILLK
jgi:hypothetical protein